MKKESKTRPSVQIPPQYTGKHLELVATRVLIDEQQARTLFKAAKSRLLDVNHWYDVAEIPASVFRLTDPFGGEVIKSYPTKNDNIRIDIPGPGAPGGDGFDWVVIEDVTDIPDTCCSLTLRPTDNPLNLSAETAHFFKDSATSTLTVERRGCEVIARYFGRNEVVNDATDSLIDKARNIAVGFMAKLGLSNPQWRSLIEGLVR